MAEIKKEYPDGLHRTEMVLVRMLRETRSWFDYQEITDALWNIRFKAECMRKEHEHLTADNVYNCKSTEAP